MTATRQPGRSLLWPAFSAILAFLILLGLGTWQMRRLPWKEGLIRAATERSTQAPQPLPVEADWARLNRETVEYRGYSLQVTYASPQWQVLIGVVVKDRPTLPPGKLLVKGWNEEETLKRAKARIDLLIESPSLH